MQLYSIFILACLSQMSFAQTKPAAKADSLAWKTLAEKEYSIQYPPAWELTQSGQMGTRFIILSPLESDTDAFRENVNLLIQDLTGYGLDLDKFTEISEGQIKTMINNSSIVESKRVKNKSTEYQRIIYTGDQGVYHLKFEQYYWVLNEKAHVLTFTSEQTRYDAFRETAEKIMNSFTIDK